jgi:crossover junction endodeoxyribonuclease RusA
VTAVSDLFAPVAGFPLAGSVRPLTVTLPAGLELINSNQRPHHYKKAKLTAAIRGAAMEAVTEDPMWRALLTAANPGPVFQRVHIIGVFHPRTRRRADPANWYPSFKAAVDGLVDAGLLDDDDHTRLIGPDMRIGDVVKGGQIVLHIRELPAVAR